MDEGQQPDKSAPPNTHSPILITQILTHLGDYANNIAELAMAQTMQI